MQEEFLAVVTMIQAIPADAPSDGSGGDAPVAAPRISAEEAKKLKGTPFMLEHQVEAGRVLDTWIAENLLFVRVGIYNTDAGQRAKAWIAESLEKNINPSTKANE